MDAQKKRLFKTLFGLVLLLLMLFADGGNTVGGRDPADPDKPLLAAVKAGVYQPEPGYGFQGAGKTSPCRANRAAATRTVISRSFN